MDLTQLSQAYAQLVAESEMGPGRPAPGTEWRAEIVLAHVIVNDRVLMGAACDLLDGLGAVIDNRSTQSLAYLEAVAGAAQSWTGLVATVSQSAREVIAVMASLGPELFSRPLPTRLIDAGVVQVDRPMSLEELLGIHASFHLPSHIRQLATCRQA